MKRLREEEERDIASSESVSGPQCPYLDTVNRQMIDFDSEKLCAVTLTNRNVYVCLVCGRYFEGRGKHTPAFTHSLEENHCVFMNVESGRAYCLPDSYEIFDASLVDVRRSLHPEFSLQDITSLDVNTTLARDVHNVTYLPGYVGLNNLGSTDGINVILHLLSHITPLRDFFLQPQLYETAAADSKLLREFGLIMRKLWSPNNFKSTISPQEFVQTLSVDSQRRFAIGKRCEAADLLIWLLHRLQKSLELKRAVKRQRKESKGLFECLQGSVEVTSETKVLVDGFAEQQLLEKSGFDSSVVDADGWRKDVKNSSFLLLTLEIPPCPLFRDSHGGLVIPHVPLFQLLQRKFNGEWIDSMTKQAHVRRQYKLLSLPQTLIFHLSRFTKNNFSMEKNPTIVTFPVKNLELRDYLKADPTESPELSRLLEVCPKDVSVIDSIDNATELVDLIRKLGNDLHQLELEHLTKSMDDSVHNLRLVARRAVEYFLSLMTTKYDLVSCVCHVSNNAARGIDVGEGNLKASFTESASTTGSALRRKSKAAANAVLNEADAEAAEADSDVVENGHYKVYSVLETTGQWFECQDLSVHETTAQQVGVSEAYILVYRKKSTT